MNLLKLNNGRDLSGGYEKIANDSGKRGKDMVLNNELDLELEEGTYGFFVQMNWNP